MMLNITEIRGVVHVERYFTGMLICSFVGTSDF